MTDENAKRKEWMAVLAQAPADRLQALWAALDLTVDVADLRAPEIGGAMVRGRAGATGAPFNLGEMTVTRASVQVGDLVGHAYVQGRDKAKARLAAIIDAVMQSGDAATVDAAVLAPLRAERASAKAARAAKAAATKVDFFTMARGED